MTIGVDKKGEEGEEGTQVHRNMSFLIKYYLAIEFNPQDRKIIQQKHSCSGIACIANVYLFLYCPAAPLQL